MHALPVGDQITLLSSRSAKYPSESRSPCLLSSSLTRAASAGPSRARGSAGRRNRYTVTTRVKMPSALVKMANRSPRALGHPLDRAGHPDQAVQGLLDPLAERVVGHEMLGQQDVGCSPMTTSATIRQPNTHSARHRVRRSPSA